MTDTSKLYEALSKFQGEVEDPPRNQEVKSGKFSFKYSDLPIILQTIRPLLSKHGLCLVSTTEIRDAQVVLVTRLVHVSGQEIKSEYPVCAINNKHQDMGGSLTYARRYNISNVTGIASVDDMDGSDAAPAAVVSRKKMSSYEARTEVNWENIQNRIRNAATDKQLDSLLRSARDRKDVWPGSYFTNALEEISKRRGELRNKETITPDSEQTLSDKLQICKNVEEVNKIHSIYQQLGYEMEDINDEFEKRIVEIEDEMREPA